MQDSGIDIVGHLTDRIAKRIGRGEARLLVQGTGSGTPLQPKGLQTSVTGTVNTAAANKVAWKEMNALKHGVDPSYRNNNSRWLFNDNTFQLVSELEDSQGRPLWLPGLDRGAPASFLGFQYEIDQAVADIAAGAKFAYFGDFKRFVEPSRYAAKTTTGLSFLILPESTSMGCGVFRNSPKWNR